MKGIVVKQPSLIRTNYVRRASALTIALMFLAVTAPRLAAAVLAISDPGFDAGGQSPVWTAPIGGGVTAAIFSEPANAVSSPDLLSISNPQTPPAGRSQATAYQVEAGTYRFSIWANSGSTANPTGQSTFQLQLYGANTQGLAGSTLLSTALFTADNLGNDGDLPPQTFGTRTWEHWTLTYIPVPADYGKYINLNIVGTAIPPISGGGANLDNVQLEFFSVPEPSTVMLLLVGGLLVCRKGVRRAR